MTHDARHARAFAQRPLPSMMIATWRGMFPRAISSSAVGVRVNEASPGIATVPRPIRRESGRGAAPVRSP
jgi:hypothetical protein